MTIHKLLNPSTLLAASAVLLAACSGDVDNGNDAASGAVVAAAVSASGTIVEVAQGDEGLSDLVSAITAADLVEALSAEGPYTVFAPINEGFAKLPEGTLARLADENTEALSNILTYHVVDGSLDAERLIESIKGTGEGGHIISTLGGGTLTATLEEGALVLTDAAGGKAVIIATDVEASNGLIHLIDAVLVPG